MLENDKYLTDVAINSFENPVETRIYSPIFQHVDRKKYLTTHHNDIYFKKRTSRLLVGGNSFENPVDPSTNPPIFRHIDRKRYLM